MDYFQPTPITCSPLGSATWGVAAVLPRDTCNGMESARGAAVAPEYYYWDGKIIRAKDGAYHLFASSWSSSLGFGSWGSSDAVHSLSTGGIFGPYQRKGFVYDDGPNSGARHKGHNVSALELPDGTYAVYVNETVPFTIFTSNSLDGPWTNRGHAPIDKNGVPLSIPFPGDQNLESNVSLTVRHDGNYQIVQRHGIIAISTTGLLGPYKVQQPTTTYPADQAVPSTLASIYPNRKKHLSAGAPQPLQSTYVYAEDPVIWYSGGQYHVIYNYPDDRVAYHLTSTDGIHDWTDRGVAYDPRQAQKLFSYAGDTTVNKWYKIERPGVVMDKGHITHFSFAVADVDKNNQIPANSNHGSKVVVVPFDGTAFDADTGVGGTGAGGSSSTGTAPTSGAKATGGSGATGGAKATGGSGASGGTKATGNGSRTGESAAVGGSTSIPSNTGGTSGFVSTGGGRISTGGTSSAAAVIPSSSGGVTSTNHSSTATGSFGIGGSLGSGGMTQLFSGATPSATDVSTPTHTDDTSDSGGRGCQVATSRTRSALAALWVMLGIAMLSRFRRRGSLILGWTLLGWLLVPHEASAQSSVEKLQEFPLDQVQVTDPYQKNLFAKDVTYLVTTLDSDRLLAGFKAVSQGANPTNLYGGWENTNIRGHSLGHWLSAVAQAYRQALGTDPTLAAQIRIKLDDVCSKLKAYQLASGFLFATPISQFDDFDAGTGSTWVPYYTMHKILAGLVDAYKYGNNADALAVASKLGDWLHNRTLGWSSSAKLRVLSQEYGGLNDALYELYKYTKSANHLTVAHVFDDTSLFTTVAAGTDNLNGKHANMTIPKFIGALNRFRTLGAGETPYLTAAQQFLSMVLKSHTYVTGGNSEDEHFRVPGTLDAHRDDDNNETCNAYNMSKLARDLFKTTGEVKYADYYERVHINEILSSINPDTGMTTYFKPMATGYFKAFGSPTNSFWCCTGTGMENFAKLGDSVYFHDAKDLWVTYYVSSTLDWKDRGLSLTQTTDLPLTSRAEFTIDAAPLDALTVRFRKPYWLASCQSMTIAVNGQSMIAEDANGFLSVSRVWQAGDKLELTIPAEVQVSRLPDASNTVAFTYGPLVLSAGLGTASMTTAGHAWTLVATKPTGLQETITISGSTTINSWLANIKDNLVQAAGKLEFGLRNTDSDAKLVFVPHFSRYKDRYGIYWKLAGTTGAAVSPAACPASGAASGAGGASGRTSMGGNSGVPGGNGNSGAGGSGGRSSSVASTTSSVANGGSIVSLGGATGSHSTAAKGGTGAASSRTLGGARATDTPANLDLGGHSAAPATGGNRNSTSGGAGPDSSVVSNASGDSNSGCSCRLSDSSARTPWSLGLLIALGLTLLRRRGFCRAIHPRR